MGCGTTSRHYSAQSFRSCVLKQQPDAAATLTHDRGSASTVVALMTDSYAGWVYFFRDSKSAKAERAKLAKATTPSLKTFWRLFRKQQSNALIFAPKRADAATFIGSCLRHSTTTWSSWERSPAPLFGNDA